MIDQNHILAYSTHGKYFIHGELSVTYCKESPQTESQKQLIWLTNCVFAFTYLDHVCILIWHYQGFSRVCTRWTVIVKVQYQLYYSQNSAYSIWYLQNQTQM